jgi:hypothetical protein
MTLLVTKTLVVSYLNSTFRYFPGHTNYIDRFSTSIFS